MRCGACGCHATRYLIAHPLTAQPLDLHRCEEPLCRRERAETSQGPRWIKSPFYCADPECRAPIWRMVRHPVAGHLVPLWPDPSHLVAEYAVLPDERIGAGAVTLQPYCGPGCAPDLGAPPHHDLEEGGVPHTYQFGGCVGFRDVRERFAECFTDARGHFYRTWLGEIGVPEEERDRLMAQWERDRA